MESNPPLEWLAENSSDVEPYADAVEWPRAIPGIATSSDITPITLTSATSVAFATVPRVSIALPLPV